MSIVKNSTGVTTDVTIMKLEKDVALASPPLPSNHPLTTSGGYTTKYYLELNNYYFQLGFYSRAGETVLIKAEIQAGATGYIYGAYHTQNRRYIRVASHDSSTYIQWITKSGDDAEVVAAEREVDGKVHVFGYVGGETNDTRWSKPFYDGDIIDNTEETVSYATAKALFLKNHTEETAFGKSGDSSTIGIKVYEIAGSCYPKASDTAQYNFHYYAALNSSSAACLMETRYDLNGLTGTAVGSTNRNAAVNFPSIGYGVQLDDLKVITGSGYNDLIALMSEDGGVDTAAGWDSQSAYNNQADAPCVLAKSGETSRNTAIYIGKGNSHIPLPDGWAVSQDSTRPYELGDKIIGRKLKGDLSIWNDAVDFGFYVNEYKQLKFNIFKRLDGSDPSGETPGTGSRVKTDGRFHLEWLNGYNTGTTLHHPFLTVEDSNLVLHVHNGAMLKCEEGDIIAGVIDADYRGNEEHAAEYVTDNDCVYALNETVGGALTYRLGNLVPWNRTLQEAEYSYFIPMGMRVVFNLDDEAHSLNHDYLTTTPLEALTPYLTKDASEATKAIYQDTGITEAAVVGTGRWYFLDMLQTYSNVAVYPRLVMIASVGSGGKTDVDTANFVPVHKCPVTASYNPSLATNAVSPRYRTVIDYHGASDADKIGIVGPEGDLSEKNHNRVFTRRSYYWYTDYTYTGLPDPFAKSEWNYMIAALESQTATVSRSDNVSTWVPADNTFKDDIAYQRQTWSWEWRVYQENSTWKAQFRIVYRFVGNSQTATQGFYHTFDAADYSNCWETWHDRYLHDVEGTETAIVIPIIGVTESGSSFSPVYSNSSYVALLEAFWEYDSGGTYEYRNFVRTSLSGPGALATYQKEQGVEKGPYQGFLDEWWPGYASSTKTHCVWHNGSAINVTSSNISNLKTYTREFAIRKEEFGVAAADDLPYNMTVIAHIWPSSIAPVFFKLLNYGWDYKHHVMTVPISYSGNSRVYAYSGTYWEGEVPEGASAGTYHTQINWKSYSVSSSVYTEDKCVGCYVKVYRNGSVIDTLNFTSFNNVDLAWKSSVVTVSASGTYSSATMFNNAALAYNEMFYGLDGEFNNQVFGLSIYVVGCSTGDNIEIEFTNSAT